MGQHGLSTCPRGLMVVQGAGCVPMGSSAEAEETGEAWEQR